MKVMKYILAFLLLVPLLCSAKNIYIHTINTPIDFMTLEPIIRDLAKAKAGDILTIYIETPGGSVRETVRLIEAIKNTKAQVLCKAKRAISGGAAIFMACPIKSVDYGAIILIHHAKGTNPIDTIVPDNFKTIPKEQWTTYFYVKKLYRILGVDRLLTQDEWYRLGKGEDIVLNGEEFIRRCAKMKSCIVGASHNST